MIVIGAARYVFAQGDPGNLTKARNTILYSLLGLVVCVFAYAIVGFVAARLT